MRCPGVRLPAALEADPSARPSAEPPVGAVSWLTVAARNGPEGARSVFGQLSPANVATPLWSMRLWESAPVIFITAAGVPGSHGPAGGKASTREVTVRATSRHRSGPRRKRLTLSQPLPPDVPALPWSMPPWESAPVIRFPAAAVPGSHGPAEGKANGRKVTVRLTSRRRPGRPRRVAWRQRSERSRPCWARRTRRARGHDDIAGAVWPADGIGRATGPARGARRWRRPAS